MENNKPILITFEGLDGCGKTTIVERIKDILKEKYKVYLSYEPGNMFGHLAKFGCPGLEKQDSLYLWWLARRFEQNKPEYKSADIILKDRYYDSTFVYQNLQFDNTLTTHNYDFAFFQQPDLTIILDIDYQLALNRTKKRKDDGQFEVKDVEVLLERKNMFNNLKLDFPEREFLIIVVDELSIDEIVDECLINITQIMDLKVA